MPAVDRGIDNEEEEEDLRRRTSPPSRGAVAASVAVEREEEHQGAKARSPSTPTSPTGAGNKRDTDSPGFFLCTLFLPLVSSLLLMTLSLLTPLLLPLLLPLLEWCTYSFVSLFQAE